MKPHKVSKLETEMERYEWKIYMRNAQIQNQNSIKSWIAWHTLDGRRMQKRCTLCAPCDKFQVFAALFISGAI